MRRAVSGWRRLADLPIYARISLAPGLILLVLLALSLLSLRMLDADEARIHAISEQAFPTYQRAAETKDARFAGTFEVLVPVPARNKPHRVPLQFPTQQAAEGWMHSPEGKDTIAEILADAQKG